MGRDEDTEAKIEAKIEARIEAIVELGRRTRTRAPRWLWIAAGVVGVICLAGFIAMVLGDREPPRRPVAQRPASESGLGTGLVIGAGVGVVIGFAIGRQRRSHSSRSRP